MRILKYLIRNLTVLNIILVAAIVTWAVFIVSPRHITVTQMPPAKKADPVKAEPAVQSTVPSPMDYTIIAEQNLFHPERKIPVEKPSVPPPPKPEFVLYGTLIMDDTGVAYMDDKKAPYNTPGRGKRQTTLRKGESLSGFFLKEVAPDKVVMARGEETMVVNLIDASSPKMRETVAVSAPGTPAPGAGPFQPAAAQQATPRAQQLSVSSPGGTGKPQKSGAALLGNIFKR